MGGKTGNKGWVWLVGLVGWLMLTAQVRAAEFVVDTTSAESSLQDCNPAVPADCSLRGAITRANAAGDEDSIVFNIPTSDAGYVPAEGDTPDFWRIQPGRLSISQPVVIDGYTQPGAQPNSNATGGLNAVLKIEIDAAQVEEGNYVFNAENFTGGNVPLTLRGLAINSSLGGNRGAVFLAVLARGSRIEGNYIGTDITGRLARPLGEGIGASSGCTLICGEELFNVVIGGSTPAQRNLVSGNAGIAINVLATLRIEGNLIGTDATGLAALGNDEGIRVRNCGAGAQQYDVDVDILRNVVAGNRGIGVNWVSPSAGCSNPVTGSMLGNFIGVGVDGVMPLPNVGAGISLAANRRAILPIGNGSAEGENLIAHTLPSSGDSALPGTGILLGSGGLNTIRRNRFFGNAGLAIDLSAPLNARNPNDEGDVDGSGSDRLQNFPVISAYSPGAGSVELTYAIDTEANHPYAVNFYLAEGDEGALFLGSDAYTGQDAALPVKTVIVPLPDGVMLDLDDVIVATAESNDGHTSEFSFHPLALEISGLTENPIAGLPVNVQVTATALAGPFKPNGVVVLSLNTSPGTNCELSLQPGPGAFESTGSCQFIPTQAGDFTLTATYDTLRGAFGSESGGNVTANASLVVGQPGPEQLSFASCRAVALEGRDLIVRVARPSGVIASVSVTLQHETGTATPGVDYTAPATQTLSWAPGDMTPKLVTIPIASDGIAEPVETFRLRLTNPVNTAILPHALMEVSILDGDLQGFRDGFEGDCPQ